MQCTDDHLKKEEEEKKTAYMCKTMWSTVSPDYKPAV